MPKTTKALGGAELVRLLSNPRSIVVVGASEDPNSYGSRPLRYLLEYGYQGEKLALNPNRDEVMGVRCVRSASQIEPGSVEVAMLTIPAKFVAQSLRELSEVGVKTAIVIASGFDAGEGELRTELKALLPTLPMRVIGPNCIGVCASESSAYPSFSGVLRQGKPRTGSIAIVSQSGAMGNSMLTSLLRRGAGISHYITTGEEADTGALELTAGLLADPNVAAVGIFMEGIGDLEWLPKVAELVRTTGKQVHVMKGARTAAGRSAAVGHTGRVVGSADVAIDLMAEAGIVLQPNMASLADALVAIDILRRTDGPRVAVATVSGGSGVQIADGIVETGRLALSSFADDKSLEEFLGGRVTSITNPLDTGGSTVEVFAEWIDRLARRDDVDSVIAVFARMMYPDEKLVEALETNAAGRKTVILVPFSEAQPLFDGVAERLAKIGIASTPSVDRAVAMLNVLTADSTLPAKEDEGSHHIEADPRLVGLEQAAQEAPELPWSRFAIVETPEEARAAAAAIGFPMVVKIAGRTIHHRSDVGGVIVNVDEAKLDDAVARIHAITGPAKDAIMLQHMVSSGFELMVSGLIDAEFGAIVIIRIGGVLAELIDGQVILWAGSTPERRRERLLASKVGRLLNGYRGGKVYDVEAVLALANDVLARLEKNTFDFIELNPVIVHEKDVHLVDALIRI